MIQVNIKMKDGCEDLFPVRATTGSAAFDICAAYDFEIKANCFGRISCGFSMELPENCVALIFNRSGLAAKSQIILQNAVGVIDSDYRGEVFCVFKNQNGVDFAFERGQRIAQMVIMELPKTILVGTGVLSKTARDEGGFGSTGL